MRREVSPALYRTHRRFSARRAGDLPIMVGVFMLMGLAANGCDKLPGLSFNKKTGSTASLTTAQSGVTPSRPFVVPTDIVANINSVPISKTDMELRIQELKSLITSAGQEWKPLTQEQMEEVLKELINTELASQDAVARGIDRETETQRRWEYLRRGFFRQEWLRWHREHQEVTSAEVEKYYGDNKLGFRQPERRRLRQLTVGTEEQAKQALSRLLGEAPDFGALAQQISLAPSAKDGGLLHEWVMRSNEKAFLYATEADAKTAGVISLDPALEAAAFAIDRPNGLSNYVKGSDNHFHVFQLVERQETRQRPLSEVYDGVKNYLLLQKLQQAIDELTKQAKIEKFPERLGDVKQQ